MTDTLKELLTGLRIVLAAHREGRLTDAEMDARLERMRALAAREDKGRLFDAMRALGETGATK